METNITPEQLQWLERSGLLKKNAMRDLAILEKFNSMNTELTQRYIDIADELRMSDSRIAHIIGKFKQQHP